MDRYNYEPVDSLFNSFLAYRVGKSYTDDPKDRFKIGNQEFSKQGTALGGLSLLGSLASWNETRQRNKIVQDLEQQSRNQNYINVPTDNRYNYFAKDQFSNSSFQQGGVVKPNIQTLGNIKFDSNNIRWSDDRTHLIAKDLNTGKDYGVLRNENGSYKFFTNKLPFKNRLYISVKPSEYHNISNSTKMLLEGINRTQNPYDTKEGKRLKELDKQIINNSYNDLSTREKLKFNKERDKLIEYVESTAFGIDDDYSEDAWAKYLGLPQINNSITRSRVTPSNSKENKEYYQLPEKFNTDLIKSYNDEYNSLKNKGYTNIEIKNKLKRFNENLLSRNFSKFGSSGRVLGNFKVDSGSDGVGDYISYYDKYDLEPTIPVLNTKIKAENIIGQPFEFYNRVYINTKKPINIGNYQTEQHQQGGLINQYGYKDNSPFKNEPYLDITSPNITMKGVSQPIWGFADTGESKLMLPNQEYNFKNAKRVREIPLRNLRRFQDGGENETDKPQEYEDWQNGYEGNKETSIEDYIRNNPNDYDILESYGLMFQDEPEVIVDPEISYYESQWVSKLNQQNNQDSNESYTTSNGNSTIAQRHQTLGNMKFANWMSKYGAVPGEIAPENDGTRFAKFPSFEHSKQAHKALLLGQGYRNLSVQDGLKKYAAGTYDKNIYKELQPILNKRIGDLSENEINYLMKTQTKFEDANVYKQYYGTK